MNFSQYSYNEKYNSVKDLNSDIVFPDNFNATIKMYKKNLLFRNPKYMVKFEYNNKELTSSYLTHKSLYNNSNILEFYINFSNEDKSNRYSMIVMTSSDNCLNEVALYVNYEYINNSLMKGSRIEYITTQNNIDAIKSANVFWTNNTKP